MQESQNSSCDWGHRTPRSSSWATAMNVARLFTLCGNSDELMLFVIANCYDITAMYTGDCTMNSKADLVSVRDCRDSKNVKCYDRQHPVECHPGCGHLETCGIPICGSYYTHGAAETVVISESIYCILGLIRNVNSNGEREN